MLNDLIQRIKGNDQIIKIEKKDKLYIVTITKDIKIEEFIQIMNNNIKDLLKILNINLLLQKNNNIIKKGQVHILIEKDKIFNLYFYEDGVKCSELIKSKEEKKEDILSWESNNNTYRYSTYLDKKDRKRILLKDYQSQKDNSKEEKKEIKDKISTILNHLREIGYPIPLDSIITSLESEIEEEENQIQKKKNFQN